MSLTSHEHFLLVNLHDSDEWKALVKLMADQQLRVAQENIAAPDMETVGFNRGRVASLTWLVDTIKLEAKKKEKSNGRKQTK